MTFLDNPAKRLKTSSKGPVVTPRLDGLEDLDDLDLVFNDGNCEIISSDNIRFRVPMRLFRYAWAVQRRRPIKTVHGLTTLTMTDKDIESSHVIRSFLTLAKRGCISDTVLGSWTFWSLLLFLQKWQCTAMMNVAKAHMRVFIHQPVEKAALIFWAAAAIDDRETCTRALKVLYSRCWTGRYYGMTSGQSCWDPSGWCVMLCRDLPDAYTWTLRRAFMDAGATDKLADMFDGYIGLYSLTQPPPVSPMPALHAEANTPALPKYHGPIDPEFNTGRVELVSEEHLTFKTTPTIIFTAIPHLERELMDPTTRRVTSMYFSSIGGAPPESSATIRGFLQLATTGSIPDSALESRDLQQLVLFLRRHELTTVHNVLKVQMREYILRPAKRDTTWIFWASARLNDRDMCALVLREGYHYVWSGDGLGAYKDEAVSGQSCWNPLGWSLTRRRDLPELYASALGRAFLEVGPTELLSEYFVEYLSQPQTRPPVEEDASVEGDVEEENPAGEDAGVEDAGVEDAGVEENDESEVETIC